MLICLVTDAPRVVSQGDLFHAAVALEVSGRHIAEAWDIEPPAVVVIDREQRVPPGAVPIVFVDATSDQDFLAVHYFDAARGLPAARVYVPSCSGFNDGSASVVEAASHELELLVDPQCNLWLPHPDPERSRAGVEIALEVCDPTQDHYFVQSKGTQWRVSNFVTRWWFSADFRASPESFDPGLKSDHLGRLKPGEIGPQGYSVMRARKPDGHWFRWVEDAHSGHAATQLKPHKRSTLSRTNRRLTGTLPSHAEEAHA